MFFKYGQSFQQPYSPADAGSFGGKGSQLPNGQLHQQQQQQQQNASYMNAAYGNGGGAAGMQQASGVIHSCVVDIPVVRAVDACRSEVGDAGTDAVRSQTWLILSTKYVAMASTRNRQVLRKQL